jgi:hypothetical protein
MAHDDDVRGGTGESAEALRARLRPLPAPDQLSKQLLDGSGWEDFCERLKDLGPAIQSAAEGVPDEVHAEGYIYALGLVAAGIHHAVDVSDPRFPRFFRNPDSFNKWGAENADNHYLWVRVDPQYEYRVTGERRNSYEIYLEAKDGFMQLGDEQSFALMRSKDFEVDENGNYEIIMSAKPQSKNWFKLDPEVRYVNFRQYLVDWENEKPASIHIERIGGEGEAMPRVTPTRVGGMLHEAAEWSVGTGVFWHEWTEQQRRDYEPDRLKPATHFVGGADDIFYGNDWYDLGPDEAFVIECEPARCDYWQFQLCSYWFGTMDWATRQTSLNQHQMHIDPDGKFRVVIAHEDPGVPNWLDTAGNLQGMIQYRWIWSENNPEPMLARVNFTDVMKHMPADTPRVTEAERRRTIHIRQRHHSVREPVS